MFFVFCVCLLASTLGGVCGIGGGVIIKPILDATGIMSVSTVSFLSSLTVLTMAVISIYKNRKTKELDIVRSLPLGAGAAVGGVLGKILFEFVKKCTGADQMVGMIQALLLSLLALGTLAYVQNKSRIQTKYIRNRGIVVLIGLILGVCSSFLGIGGGPMNLAILYYFFSMNTKQAAVNSILVILLSQIMSLLVSLARGNIPTFEVPMLIAMVSAGAIGGFVSAKLHRKLSVYITDMLFSLLLIVIILICFYNIIKFI